GGRPACRLWQRRRTRGRARRENPCSLGSAPDRWRRYRPTTPAPGPLPFAAPVPDNPRAHARRRRGRELSSLLKVPGFLKILTSFRAVLPSIVAESSVLSSPAFRVRQRDFFVAVQICRNQNEDGMRKSAFLTKLRLKPSN